MSKPIIVYVKDEKEITLTREKLEELIDEAYQKGKEDGTVYYPSYPVYPNWWNTIRYDFGTGTPISNKTEITC